MERVLRFWGSDFGLQSGYTQIIISETSIVLSSLSLLNTESMSRCRMIASLKVGKPSNLKPCFSNLLLSRRSSGSRGGFEPGLPLK